MRKKEEGRTCGGFVAVLVVADRRVACSVVGSSSSLRIFLMFFSFYSIAEAATVTLEAGRLQAAVAAIFFFFPVQRAQPLFFLLVVLPFSVFFAYSVFSVVVLSGSGVGGGMKVVAVVAFFFLSSTSSLYSSLFPTNNSPTLSQTVFLFPSLYIILPEQFFFPLSLKSRPVFIGS
jgi:hypothetical protein